MAGIIRYAEYKCAVGHECELKVKPGKDARDEIACMKCLEIDVIAPMYLMFVRFTEKKRAVQKP